MALRLTIIVAAILLSLPTIADARPKHHHRHHHKTALAAAPSEFCGDRYCPKGVIPGGLLSDSVSTERVINSVGSIVSHPAGCPWRAFCGCGASIRVFGRSVRELWLARAWFRFPRAAPAPGMAAVRNHHVMILESHVGGSVWVVYDANSGGHATRIHERSIAGYVIVNPRGSRLAMN